LIQELQKPRVHVGAPEFAEYSDVHYGLAFRSHRYRGERVVWHGGGFTGTNTLMVMLPDRGVGVAVLANNGMVPSFFPDREGSNNGSAEAARLGDCTGMAGCMGRE
jgi:CubicO group peptidase (beta-lactamase class C family)